MKLHIATGVLLFFMAGCDGVPDADVVARAGKHQLSRGELLASIDYSSSEDSLTASAIYIEDWKDIAALYQLALEEGIDKDPDARMLIEKATRHIVIQRFVDRKMDNAEKEGVYAIDSAEVSAFYQEFSGAFLCPETVYAVSRYYASTLQSAGRIENALKLHDGDEKHLQQLIESIEPGYAGKNRRTHPVRSLSPLEQLHLENDRMKEVLLSLSPGEHSSVIAVNDSLFVVIEMHDMVKKGSKKTFEQAYEEIEELLIVQKQKQYYSTLLGEAREKYQ
ncbi:hypothetical protein [Prosthecochloris sp.]|uniref:hypothetical protein n=1 Tax=Prosthecochloris sp. TaxID=290513 RepID=UPI00257FAA75|nr:hypothetical protein [Prosthecochloris sp.]